MTSMMSTRLADARASRMFRDARECAGCCR